MKLIVLSPCPRHASGNVGDQLLLESALELIEEIHGSTEFEIHWRGEDFTSRLEYLNSADAILLCGFEYPEVTDPIQYRLTEDLDKIKPPMIPLSAIHRFFPGDKKELTKQRIDTQTRSFLDRVIQNCPNEQIPVRTNWVGQVLRQNDFQTILTGDPAWYDPDFIGEPFHAPDEINQLVFTTPHSTLYVEQAKELLQRCSRVFPHADRTLVLHSAPNDVDRELSHAGRKSGWQTHYASHEVNNIDFYRNSDLHIGYRFHGHLAHLRWRRPSVILAEDSRAQGLNETFGTAGVRAFDPREGLVRTLGEIHDWFPVQGIYYFFKNYGADDLLPPQQSLIAGPNPTAIDEVFEFVQEQRSNDWKAYTAVRDTIDETYKNGMKPFLKSALMPFRKSEQLSP
ncbi:MULTISPECIES: hypothetical protein [Salinibaculum]|uniref:hypothetical protein n=1 Tax=Salinibaculum TaxID=2732368 RepID=UPI0030CDCC8F